MRLSYSKISTFDSCPARYKYHYILGLKGETPEFFIAGREVHDNVHQYHTGQEYDKDLIAPYTKTFPVDYRDRSEVWFSDKLTIDDKPTDFVMAGKVDGINDEGIHDLKYMKGSISQRKADASLQATLYLWWYWSEYQKIVPFTYIIFDKVKDTISLRKTKRTLDDFRECNEILNKKIVEIEASDYGKKENYFCKYCPFRKICQ